MRDDVRRALLGELDALSRRQAELVCALLSPPYLAPPVHAWNGLAPPDLAPLDLATPDSPEEQPAPLSLARPAAARSWREDRPPGAAPRETTADGSDVRSGVRLGPAKDTLADAIREGSHADAPVLEDAPPQEATPETSPPPTQPGTPPAAPPPAPPPTPPPALPTVVTTGAASATPRETPVSKTSPPAEKAPPAAQPRRLAEQPCSPIEQPCSPAEIPSSPAELPCVPNGASTSAISCCTATACGAAAAPNANANATSSVAASRAPGARTGGYSDASPKASPATKQGHKTALLHASAGEAAAASGATAARRNRTTAVVLVASSGCGSLCSRWARRLLALLFVPPRIGWALACGARSHETCAPHTADAPNRAQTPSRLAKEGPLSVASRPPGLSPRKQLRNYETNPARAAFAPDHTTTTERAARSGWCRLDQNTYYPHTLHRRPTRAGWCCTHPNHNLSNERYMMVPHSHQPHHCHTTRPPARPHRLVPSHHCPTTRPPARPRRLVPHSTMHDTWRLLFALGLSYVAVVVPLQALFL